MIGDCTVTEAWFLFYNIALHTSILRGRDREVVWTYISFGGLSSVLLRLVSYLDDLHQASLFPQQR